MQSITLGFLANIPYIPCRNHKQVGIGFRFSGISTHRQANGRRRGGGRRATLGDPRARNFSASCWEIALLPATAGAWF